MSVVEIVGWVTIVCAVLILWPLILVHASPKVLASSVAILCVVVFVYVMFGDRESS